MRKHLIFVGFFMLTSATYSQSIERSSVNSMGSSRSSDGIFIQQSVGQPFQTNSYYSNKIESRPGFIQPTHLSVELIQSTFQIDLTAHPNPTTAEVSFAPNENLEDVVLRVMDQYGKMIFTEQVESLKNYNLECYDWSNGTYFIYITDEKGRNYESKLIKL